MSDNSPFDFVNPFEMMNNFIKAANPIRAVEKNIEVYTKQCQLLTESELFPKEYKDFVNSSANFFLGNWYLFDNIAMSYKTINSFRSKFLFGMMNKIKNGEIEYEEIVKQFQFAMKKEVELAITDEKELSKIKAQYYKYFLTASQNYLLGDTSTMLKFSEKYKDEQFWTERGMKRLKDNVRREYGLDVSSEKIYSTDLLTLYKVIPVYKEGEKPEDFEYIPQPMVVFPPTVLDHHIVSLLPNQHMSLVHHLAKHCPVYVMIINDYKDDAVLKMNEEDLVNHMVRVFEFLKLIEPVKPIFNGYCQGGTLAILATLTDRLAPYIKTVFGIVSPTGKKEGEEDFGPLSLVFDDLNLIGEMVNGSLMIGADFLKIGLKEAGWSPGSDFVKNMLFAKKCGERIKQAIADGETIDDAEMILLQEMMKKLVIDIWLESMENVPRATTKFSLDLFKDGIDEDGFINTFLFGKQLNVKKLEEYGIGLRIFAGKGDKVVPEEWAFQICDYVDHAIKVLVDCGHIGFCTNFTKGYQDYIIDAVREEYEKNPN